jgi:hypothetical protein
MPYAILGISKQKGGSVGAAGRHIDRTRETPNADPERAHLNRVLIGDPERNVRELVTEAIDARGGKPRRDSVEAIEFMLQASPEWFMEDDPAKFQKRVDRFVEQAIKFLEDPQSGGECVKAVLHMDERTPHIHAHKVPFDPDGRLNARHYLGGREKMAAMHDLYADYMKPLGLERGKRKSRATHQRLKEFYTSIDREVDFNVEIEKIPDPPKVMMTKEARDKYKGKVLNSILKELEEPFRIMRDQALLTKDEQARRVEIEKRGEALVATVEEEARAKIAEVERHDAERSAHMERGARFIVEENRELREELNALRVERNSLHEQVLKEQRLKLDYSALARKYGDRLTDVPMPEVMERLGHVGERQGQAHVYRGDGQAVAVSIEGQQAFDHQNELICRNSLDLIVHLRQHQQGVKGFTPELGLTWLRDEFGEKRAAGAYLVNCEQAVQGLFERTRLIPEHGRDPWRGPQGRTEDRDRGSRNHGSDNRGGRGFGGR